MSVFVGPSLSKYSPDELNEYNDLTFPVYVKNIVGRTTTIEVNSSMPVSELYDLYKARTLLPDTPTVFIQGGLGVKKAGK